MAFIETLITPKNRIKGDNYQVSRIRVMVVEDDDFTRSTVVSALQIQGLDVVGQSSSVSPAMNLFNEVKDRKSTRLNSSH